MENNVIYVETEQISSEAYEQKNEINFPVNVDEGDVSIAVLAYNKVEKTRECVESILKYTPDTKYKLYLVDNGSDDDLLEYFKSVNYVNKQIIKIKKNVGAMYATNVLIKSIKTKYMVLFMNDTMATYNWLPNLKKCMESDSRIGLVCPISNNISNRQNLMVPQFADYEEMHKWAARYNNNSDSKRWEERIRIIPVVGMYRREVFDEVGVMDLAYKHEFADDDFSMRLRRGGYKMMLCLDTYMPHNHTMVERQETSEKEQTATDWGRNLFKKKFKGIEPWLDMINFIGQFLPEDMVLELGEKYLCGIDVKCGTPLLDLKNFCRARGIEKIKIDAITSDGKYYADLQTIADNVVCQQEICTSLEYKKENYDMLAAGEPINTYHQPQKVLWSMNQSVKKEGIYVFSITNTSGIAELLKCLGITSDIDKTSEQQISENDILKWLEEWDVAKVTINYEPYNYIPQSVNDFVVKILESVKGYINVEEAAQKLINQKIWFTVQK